MPDLTVQGAKGALYETAQAVGGSASSANGVANGSHGAVDAAKAIERVKSGNYREWVDDEWDLADSTAGQTPASLAKATVKLSRTSFSYTGKALKPKVTVTLGGRKLAQGKDYTVKYASNKNPGKARVTVTGKGSYTGKKSAAFKISLAASKVTKASAAGRGAASVKWSRAKAGKPGYQVRYSTAKSMKGAKAKKYKKNSATGAKITHLKSGKRYWVQVRTYKAVGKKTYHSVWSAKTPVKVK